jgi:hypothetical protein
LQRFELQVDLGCGAVIAKWKLEADEGSANRRLIDRAGGVFDGGDWYLTHGHRCHYADQAIRRLRRLRRHLFLKKKESA